MSFFINYFHTFVINLKAETALGATRMFPVNGHERQKVQALIIRCAVGLQRYSCLSIRFDSIYNLSILDISIRFFSSSMLIASRHDMNIKCMWYLI